MSLPLPPSRLRQGGRHFKSDEDFLSSGMRDADRLRESAGLAADSMVLDFGCGAGRFAYGLIYTHWFDGSYLGLEVQPRHVEWCDNTITSAHPSYRFELIEAQNDRYNPRGTGSHFLPVKSRSVDLFYAYSVFSHMAGVDVRDYLEEISRVLAPTGRAFVTVFTEADVPYESVNPRWYGTIDWSLPLHCVLFDVDWLDYLIRRAGLTYDAFYKGAEVDGQTGLVLRRADPEGGSLD